MTRSKEITVLLSELHNGDQSVDSQLMPLIYEQLRRIAASYFAHERPGHTLQPTALIQKTYLRLIKPGTGPWRSREHFFGVAARAMREILVDYARAHGATKRGGTLTRIDLNKAVIYSPEKSRELLNLDEALKRLEKLSRRQSRVVELRFFGGLTVQETAAILHVGVTSVKSDWAFAKAWLRRELEKTS